MAEERNWSQVRKDTDTGRTGDKVDFPDPAASPLGSDEEAGGNRTPGDEIKRSESERSTEAPRERPGVPLAVWAVIAVIIIAAVLLLAF